MNDLLSHGWVWGVAWLVGIAFAIAYTAALEAIDTANNIGPAVNPSEGSEADNETLVNKEIV